MYRQHIGLIPADRMWKIQSRRSKTWIVGAHTQMVTIHESSLEAKGLEKDAGGEIQLAREETAVVDRD